MSNSKEREGSEGGSEGKDDAGSVMSNSSEEEGSETQTSSEEGSEAGWRWLRHDQLAKEGSEEG